MDEQDTTPPPQQQNPSPQGLSWMSWPGVSVYGVHKDAPPPDYLAPMQATPVPHGVQGPAPGPQQPTHAQPAAPPPTPAPEQQQPFPLPSPLGPAMTPDDRARELGFIPPDPPQHP